MHREGHGRAAQLDARVGSDNIARPVTQLDMNVVGSPASADIPGHIISHALPVAPIVASLEKRMAYSRCQCR